jgi:hypothetical protein
MYLEGEGQEVGGTSDLRNRSASGPSEKSEPFPSETIIMHNSQTRLMFKGDLIKKYICAYRSNSIVAFCGFSQSIQPSDCTLSLLIHT